MILNWGFDFASQVTSGNVWKHFWLSTCKWGRMLFIWWAEAREAAKFPEMHRAASPTPTTKNYQPQMLIVPRLRNPGVIYQFMKRAIIPTSHPLICSSSANYTSLCPQISLHSSARILLLKPQQAMLLHRLSTLVPKC